MSDRSDEHVYVRKAVTTHKVTVHCPDCCVCGPVFGVCGGVGLRALLQSKQNQGLQRQSERTLGADRKNGKPRSCQRLPKGRSCHQSQT